MKIIAIHQPNYLPWPGYFLKMMLCDEFVFLDHVQFSKPSYTHRALFQLPNDQVSFLSIPTASSARKRPINQVAASDQMWLCDHLRKLTEWLKKYANYIDLEFLWENFEASKTDSLATFNEKIIRLIAQQLEIDCSFVNSSSLGLTSHGSRLVADIAITRKATSYITGTGFLNYYNHNEWPSDIELSVIDFKSLIEVTDLSTNSIVENIAKLGVKKTRGLLNQICSSQQE